MEKVKSYTIQRNREIIYFEVIKELALRTKGASQKYR